MKRRRTSRMMMRWRRPPSGTPHHAITQNFLLLSRSRKLPKFFDHAKIAKNRPNHASRLKIFPYHASRQNLNHAITPKNMPNHAITPKNTPNHAITQTAGGPPYKLSINIQLASIRFFSTVRVKSNLIKCVTF